MPHKFTTLFFVAFTAFIPILATNNDDHGTENNANALHSIDLSVLTKWPDKHLFNLINFNHEHNNVQDMKEFWEKMARFYGHNLEGFKNRYGQTMEEKEAEKQKSVRELWGLIGAGQTLAAVEGEKQKETKELKKQIRRGQTLTGMSAVMAKLMDQEDHFGAVPFPAKSTKGRK